MSETIKQHDDGNNSNGPDFSILEDFGETDSAEKTGSTDKMPALDDDDLARRERAKKLYEKIDDARREFNGLVSEGIISVLTSRAIPDGHARQKFEDLQRMVGGDWESLSEPNREGLRKLEESFKIDEILDEVDYFPEGMKQRLRASLMDDNSGKMDEIRKSYIEQYNQLPVGDDHEVGELMLSEKDPEKSFNTYVQYWETHRRPSRKSDLES